MTAEVLEGPSRLLKQHLHRFGADRLMDTKVCYLRKVLLLQACDMLLHNQLGLCCLDFSLIYLLSIVFLARYFLKRPVSSKE